MHPTFLVLNLTTTTIVFIYYENFLILFERFTRKNVVYEKKNCLFDYVPLFSYVFLNSCISF